MKYSLVIITFSLLGGLLSCSLKPDSSGSDLGTEFSSEELNKVMVGAMAGYPQEGAFRKGDVASVMFIDKVMKQEAVREIRDLKVMDITSSEIVIYEQQRATGKLFEHKLPRKQGEFGQASISKSTPSWVMSLPRPFKKWLVSLFDNVINRISVEPSTAIAESVFTAATEDIKKVSRTPVLKNGQMSGQEEKMVSRFFGLKTFKHKIVTQNTAQFPDGKIAATRVEFNQVITIDGKDQRVHHSYEFSTQGPGLTSLWNDFPYISMESCFSQLIDQEGTSIPYTRCYTVGDFRLAN